MLQVGDTIKCHDKEEMVQLMAELEKEDIHTDFLYEKDGVKGLWLVVVDHYQTNKSKGVNEVLVDQLKLQFYSKYRNESIKFI